MKIFVTGIGREPKTHKKYQCNMEIQFDPKEVHGSGQDINDEVNKIIQKFISDHDATNIQVLQGH